MPDFRHQIAIQQRSYQKTRLESNLQPSRRPARKSDQGFTLIELMITVVILGILAAIAIPNYQQYVKKSRRTDAKSALLDLAARQEKFFSTNNVYTTSGTALGYASAFPIAINSSGTSYYSMTVSQTGTGNYTATATPSGSQATDACYAYVVNYLGAQSNTQGPTGTAIPTDCW